LKRLLTKSRNSSQIINKMIDYPISKPFLFIANRNNI
jgi:hypothetical protein